MIVAEKLFASWASGYAAFPETANLRTLRQGFGVTFTIPGGRSEWIHLPIPTPVITEHDRATLDKVLVLYHARQNSAITELHVFDGPRRIARFSEMRHQGDHAQGVDSRNVFSIRQANIAFGIGVTLLVTNLSTSGDSEFFISSFGGDFFHNL
ncbi:MULTISPECIES: DUF6623 family protein [unclassified Nonomuraea]|uniref:DUF6623 family protein n=1 Tax=unclassified Nonomuraea TaxID=2593643 RepID=UPI0035C15FDE